ncbi:MAG: hypothetical protein RIC93_00630, partial [Alphaproteobacteria bacterium]
VSEDVMTEPNSSNRKTVSRASRSPGLWIAVGLVLGGIIGGATGNVWLALAVFGLLGAAIGIFMARRGRSSG